MRIDQAGTADVMPKWWTPGWTIGVLAIVAFLLYWALWNKHWRDRHGPFW
jgi:hypothetical protein